MKKGEERVSVLHPLENRYWGRQPDSKRLVLLKTVQRLAARVFEAKLCVEIGEIA